jgi:hypothetical protein
MQAADPLAQLHDIVLPQAISWWPLAWGWWLLLALILGVVLSIIFFRQRTIKRNQYRREAVQELTDIFLRYQEDKKQEDRQIARLLQQVNILLRRTAMSAQPQNYPVDIQGRDWLQWLATYCPETTHDFTAGVGEALLTGPYQLNPNVDAVALQSLVNTWLLRHRNQWQKRSVADTRSHHKKEADAHA